MKKVLSPKVEAMYKAVLELLLEGVDITKIKVIDITTKAGIGKGTAYEYFKSREEIIGNALLYYRESWMQAVQDKVNQMEHFMDIMDYLLELVQRNSKGEMRLFFLQIMYVMHNVDQSEELQQIRSIIGCQEREQCIGNKHMDGVARIVQKALESGELKKEYPSEYIQCSLNGRILSYLTYCVSVSAEKAKSESEDGKTSMKDKHFEEEKIKCSTEEMKQLILQSIQKEFCV